MRMRATCSGPDLGREKGRGPFLRCIKVGIGLVFCKSCLIFFKGTSCEIFGYGGREIFLHHKLHLMHSYGGSFPSLRCLALALELTLALLKP